MFDFLRKNKNKEEKVKEFDLFAMVDGELVSIEEVEDPVFAQRMMGDGFAFKPTNGEVQSPCQAEILNVFPTKHAIALKNSGVEILLPFGIDTVALEGAPFEVQVQEGDQVSPNTDLAKIDLSAIKEAGKDDIMIVILTNGNETVEEMIIDQYGPVKRGDKIGSIRVK